MGVEGHFYTPLMCSVVLINFMGRHTSVKLHILLFMIQTGYSSFCFKTPLVPFSLFPLSSYSCWGCYLTQIALGNILKFRKKNWQFDFFGGVIYFILVFSMFPQVKFF